jgi:outer membrane lipoprotein SlyB
MTMNKYCLAFVLSLLAFEVHADSSTLDAAIGGGIGGAAGAAIGNEVGGRDGAIIGGALGGGVGAALNTEEESHHADGHENVYYRRSQPVHEYPASHFCPPGQAKKGRC